MRCSAVRPDGPRGGSGGSIQVLSGRMLSSTRPGAASGLRAIGANPDDVWAIHAVAHTYEMEGRVDEGLAFRWDRSDDWGRGNLLRVHNWWHLSLYHLEAGDHPGVLSIYGEQVHNEDSAPVAMELLDATAM